MEDNSKMDFRKTGRDNIYWIQPAWDMIQWRGFVSAVKKPLNLARDFYTLRHGVSLVS
jgi:hypothetical protein